MSEAIPCQTLPALTPPPSRDSLADYRRVPTTDGGYKNARLINALREVDNARIRVHAQEGKKDLAEIDEAVAVLVQHLGRLLVPELP